MSGIISYTQLGGKSGVIGSLPSFLAYGTGSNYVGEGSSYVLATGDAIKFNATKHNIGGCFSTSSYEFTAPVNGRYQFSWCVCIQSVYNDSVNAIELETTPDTTGHSGNYMNMQDNKIFDASKSDYWPFTGSLCVELASGSTANLRYRLLSGSGPDYVRIESWFSGCLISN